MGRACVFEIASNHGGIHAAALESPLGLDGGFQMANMSEFALKHGLATAGAIPATVAANWYLETLSAEGVALLFVLFLAVFNGIAALRGGRRGGED